MTGGEISFNQSGKGGAGVGNYGTFHFSGGRITANTSTNDGNDVYLHADSKNPLYMNGAPMVGSLFLPGDKVITVNGAFTDGAGIVVEFDTDNTLRVTFKTDGSRALGSYTFLLDGVETVSKKSGKNGYLQVKNIAAPNLDTPHTFTVTDGTDTYTVTASALS